MTAEFKYLYTVITLNFSTIKKTFWSILQKWGKIRSWLEKVKKSTKNVTQLVNHHNFEGKNGLYICRFELKKIINIYQIYVYFWIDKNALKYVKCVTLLIVVCEKHVMIFFVSDKKSMLRLTAFIWPVNVMLSNH